MDIFAVRTGIQELLQDMLLKLFQEMSLHGSLSCSLKRVNKKLLEKNSSVNCFSLKYLNFQ